MKSMVNDYDENARYFSSFSLPQVIAAARCGSLIGVEVVSVRLSLVVHTKEGECGRQMQMSFDIGRGIKKEISTCL